MNIIGGTLIGLFWVLQEIEMIISGSDGLFLFDFLGIRPPGFMMSLWWGIVAIASLYAVKVMMQAVFHQSVATSQYVPPVHSGTNMQSVVNVLDQQKANAEKDVQRLRRQLDGQSVSASQMATMQVELANLQQMVADSEHVKQQMEQEMEELRKSGGDASLEMQDSVIGGDSMVGSTKIEKQQIINDPEAIARAAVEAYRMAKNEENN